MESKIIGFKAPHDFFGGDIRKGDILLKNNNNKSLRHASGHELPYEIAYTWEPVYDTIIEIKDPEMFINLKSTGMTVMPFVASHVIHKNEKEAKEEAKEIINHAGTFKLIKI